MDPPAYGTGSSSDGAHRQDPRAAPGPSSPSSPAPPLASSPAPATAPPAPLPTVSISPAPPVPAPETPPASPSRRQHAVAAAQLTPPGPAASPARHYESSDGHTAHSDDLDSAEPPHLLAASRRPSNASTVPDSVSNTYVESTMSRKTTTESSIAGHHLLQEAAPATPSRPPGGKAPRDLEAGLNAADAENTLDPDNSGRVRDASNPGLADTEVAADPELRPKLFGIFPRRARKPAEVAAIVDPTAEEMAPFAPELLPSALYDLVDPKSLDHLRALGGPDAVMRGLHTDPKRGLDEDDAAGKDGKKSVARGEDRRRVYGENRVPAKKPKSFLALCWAAYTDKVLIILSIAAVVSLALGLYQDLGTPPHYYPSTSCPPTNMCKEPQVDWVEGVAITIAILIVVMVGSVNDWQKERQFQKLNAQKEERNVKVYRNGQERLMSVYDVVVGDVLTVEPGEIVPVDGLFLGGHNVRCDESGATGESDTIRKVPYDELVSEKGGPKSSKSDCFMISGSKVVEGVGSYVVTSVGRNSFHGKIMMSLMGDTEDTPLQLKLNALAELIAKLGSAAGLLLFTALMIRFFVQLKVDPNRTPDEKAQAFIQVLIISVTVVVVAVPEGLPLAVTLALAFATRRMTKMNLLVRVLGACETMANATCVCTDKTGTLTTNKMTVVAGSVGVHLKFAAHLDENRTRTNANDDRDPEKLSADGHSDPSQPPSPTLSETPTRRKGRLDFSADMTDISKHASPALKKLLNDSIVINSTAFEGTDEHGAEGGFVGSKTETALMSFAQNQGWAHYRAVREGAEVVQMVPFSSDRKCMGVVIRLPNGRYRLFLKGASEVLAKLASRHVVVHEQGGAAAEGETEDADVPTAEFDEETRGNITRTIIFYACQSLRTIALCSRDFEQWPPRGCEVNGDGEVAFADLARDLTLIGVTAIEDPLREGVAKAVATCQGAGVMVKMCTGDNVLTARSIATQCGIFSKGGIIMEGPVFRKLTDQQRLEIVPNLQVLARSSPEDKKILVETLKGMGEVVGVTGDGTNDGPALKTANVGFSMGIAGTEVAKEASDIILMDDNFASIVSAIMWGRCVNDSVRKFLQFQLSVNITAVIITFITAVASEEESSVLTAVQLLWINLIMDTFAALALATDPADPESLERKPDRKTAPLISVQMWIMILGQSVYQLTVALVLNFAGHQILNLNSTDPALSIDQQNELSTLIFNAFTFSQIFNMINSRRLDRKLNILTGIHRNYWFLIIFAIMVGGQALIINVGGAAFQVVRIGGRDWAISLVIGLLSIPLGALLRCLPPGPFHRFLVKMHLYPSEAELRGELPSSSNAAEEYKWAEGIQKAIDGLRVYSTVRGGRARAASLLKFKRPVNPDKQLAAMDMHPTYLMAMVPSLVIGSIGGGWRPENGTLDNPAAHNPSSSTQQLVERGLGQNMGGHSRSPSMSNTLPTVKEESRTE